MSKVSLDEIILGLIAECATHGYELLEHFRNPAKLGNIWHLGTSQLYTILKRLENEGDIDGREVFTANAPPRTEYCLTRRGQLRLRNWLDEASPSASTRQIRTAFFSRLYIARLQGVPPGAIVRRQINACQERRQFLLEQQKQIAPGIAHLASAMLVAELDAIIQWLHNCEEQLAGLDFWTDEAIGS